MQDRDVLTDPGKDYGHGIGVMDDSLYVSGCDCSGEVKTVEVAEQMVELIQEWIKFKKAEGNGSI